MSAKRTIIIGIVVLAVGFLGWRFVRPMNIFVVSKAFERPISTVQIPQPLDTPSAAECGACHQTFL